MKSVKRKLILWFSLCMSSIFVFTGVFKLYMVKDKLQGQYEYNEMVAVEKISGDIDKSMNDIQSTANAISKMSEKLNYNKDNYLSIINYLEASLLDISKNNKDLETVYTFYRPDMRVNNELPYVCVLKDKEKGAVPFSVPNINDFKYWEQDWYSIGKDAENFKWTEPYNEEATGRNLISGVKKMVNDKGEFIGVSGIDVNMDRINYIMRNVKLKQNGFCFLLSQQGTYIYHPDKQYVLKKKITDNGDKLLPLKNQLLKNSGSIKLTFDDEDYYVFHQRIPSTNWVLVLAYPVNIINAELYNMIAVDIVILIFGIVLIIGIAVVLSRGALKDITVGVEASKALSKGDLTYNKSVEVKDEIGYLINTINNSIADIRDIVKNINQDISNLNSVVGKLNISSEAINYSSDSIVEKIKWIKEDISSQNRNIEDIYRGFIQIDNYMQNIYELSKENVDRTKQSVTVVNKTNEIVGTSIDELDKVITIIEFAVDAINNLKERTTQIESTVDLIKNVVKQTKLLSLNASIEAARSGVYGKGFAVVATEIKNLSYESEETLKKVELLTKEIVEESKETVERMNLDVQHTINELNNVKETKGNLENIVDNLSSFENFSRELKKLIELQKDSSLVIKEKIKDISSTSLKHEESINDILKSTEEQKDTVNTLNENSKIINVISTSLKNLISKFKI